MQNENITVQPKHVYGEKKIYPICDRALSFARIAGTKTLTINTIIEIKKLGFGITIQPEVL